ncbi:MAG: rhodanese-like domain-containing protein [Polaribacter sp.]
MKNIDQKEWRKLVATDSNALIIDVRTLNECEEGIIKNAVMIDFLNESKFISEVEKLDKSKNYYVYCRSGNRSSKACKIFKKAGVNTIFNLLGGMLAWTGDIELPQ